MILLLAALAGAVATSQPLDEAGRALAAGRPEQARQMIAVAVAGGASGPQVETLLADLAFAKGDWPRALAGYERLLTGSPDDPRLLEQAGIAALNLGDLARALRLLGKATAQADASWRAWNALGVAHDRKQNWAVADRAYAAADRLSPGNAKVLNNQGWSLLLRGNWAQAVGPLTKAAKLDPSNPRIAANLDLAASAVAASLPRRRPGETGENYAARLNDAGVTAFRQGDRARAIAAFAQALESSERWFVLAANNLSLVESTR